MIAEVVDRITKAQRPIIIGGEGVVRSGAREQELYPLDTIAAAFVTERMMHLLRGLL